MLGFQQIKSMFTDEIRAEKLAEVFHHYHQVLNEDMLPRTAAVESWDDLSQGERDRLITVARMTLAKLDHDTAPREYFAKPGEAEWGC
jgi:hypothetical protein